jgi:hypothetical protein
MLDSRLAEVEIDGVQLLEHTLTPLAKSAQTSSGRAPGRE